MQPIITATRCAGCTSSGTVYGTVTQVSGIDPVPGSIDGLFKGKLTDAAISYPASSCSGMGGGDKLRQYLAYIPNTDAWGNSTHGVTASGTGTDVAGGLLTRDYWLHQTNPFTNSLLTPSTKNIDNVWASSSACGSEPSRPFYTNCNAGTGGNGVGSNFIQSGEPNYGSGTTLRLDQPSTIVAISMNTEMAEAYSIRHDSAYHIVINTIYLTGNGGDSVDHEFLPAMSKVQNIGPLPYQSAALPTYQNPAYVSTQEQGLYHVTPDKTQLTGLFANLASAVLRLSN